MIRQQVGVFLNQQADIVHDRPRVIWIDVKVKLGHHCKRRAGGQTAGEIRTDFLPGPKPAHRLNAGVLERSIIVHRNRKSVVRNIRQHCGAAIFQLVHLVVAGSIGKLH